MVSDEMHNAKSSIDAIERIKSAALPPDSLPLPESLAHLDPGELETLERSLVRRLDCTMMPVIALLFLLNIM